MGVVFVYTVALLISIGAFITGYGIGSVNGLANFVGFLETFSLLSSDTNTSSINSTDDGCNQASTLQPESLLILGTMISSITIGGGLATLTSGKPTDLLGRRTMLLFTAVLIVVGAVLQTASFFSWMFILGRLLSGFAYGIIYVAAPVYIAEISPQKIRGKVTSLIGPTITLGIATGYVASFLLNREVYGWRVSRSLLCVMGMVYFIALLFLPRSPRWLVLHEKEEEAKKVLKRILPPGLISMEIENIKKSVSLEKKSLKMELKMVFNWRVIKRIILGGLVHTFASASGNYIFYYSETLFCSFGIMPFVTLIVVGVLSVLGTIFATAVIDKVGRKVLLVSGALVLAALNVLSATLILIFNLEEEENVVVSYIIVCLICIFALVFCATLYVTPIVMTGEMFPLEVRAVGNGVASFFYWVTASLTNQLFPYLLLLLRAYGTLYLIGCINIAAALYYILFVPETKGVSLEDMDRLFNKSCFVGLSRCTCTCCTKTNHPSQPVMPSVASTVPLTDLVTEDEEMPSVASTVPLTDLVTEDEEMPSVASTVPLTDLVTEDEEKALFSLSALSSELIL